MDRRAYVRTMRHLESLYPFRDWSRGLSRFEILISTILSQSTTAANERRGLEGLRARFGSVTPDRLAAASEEEIREAIWHAGLSRRKAPRIRAVAERVLVAWNSDIGGILALPLDEARHALMRLPGVGPKTADVVLAMGADRPVLPVDTHILRIARRWRLVDRGGYEVTRTALEAWTPPEKRKVWHLALIAHGRSLCKARAPRCGECPVRGDCDWYRRERARVGRSRKPKHGAAARPRQKVKSR